MTATETAAVPGRRRADAGTVRLSQRDITGLVLCAEHAGAPYDLLAAALRAQPARLRAIVARWRTAGYAETGQLGPGPAWCWLTPAGMAAAGLGYPAARPPLARLDHLRAVLAARLWFTDNPAWDTHVGIGAAARYLGYDKPDSFRRARTRHPITGETRTDDGRPCWTPAALRSWQSKRKIAGQRSDSRQPG